MRRYLPILLSALAAFVVTMAADHTALALQDIGANASVGSYVIPGAMRPGAPETVTIGSDGGTLGCTAAQLAGRVVRVTCAADTTFLVVPDGGSTMPDSTSNEFPSPGPEDIALDPTDARICFYKATSTTCKVAARGR